MQAPSEALFLAQIVLLLVVGRLMGEAMQRIGQPAVMGQLIAGILLGPSVFGAIWPEAQRAVFAANPQQQSMIDAVSQLGILMLLLLTGMETDLRLVRHPYQAIIDTAVSKGCDLIVMASHGRHGVSAIILGSETVKGLTHSKIPVLVHR